MNGQFAPVDGDGKADAWPAVEPHDANVMLEECRSRGALPPFTRGESRKPAIVDRNVEPAPAARFPLEICAWPPVVMKHEKLVLARAQKRPDIHRFRPHRIDGISSDLSP